MVDFKQIITKNDKMLSTINVAKKIAASDISVLITGEEGVGKNLLAHAIHDYSNRREGPFVSVNCSAIPASLLNAELFGAPEGSAKNKTPRGQLELANHGTLFLNEIGEINLATQARLFQAIESKHYKKEGSSQTVELDVRIISAASSNLIVKVEDGQFRMDLYYRIREMSLEIPPLRERKEDIPLLMDYFVKQYAVDFGT
jgi:transcriptional regulator with PAS, ATPase and Fis domain